MYICRWYKRFIKGIIFTIATVPAFYYFTNDLDDSDIDNPFSAFSSLAFLMVETKLMIEIPLMLLSINSFLVWSIGYNRGTVVNFLDIISIIWVILLFFITLSSINTEIEQNSLKVPFFNSFNTEFTNDNFDNNSFLKKLLMEWYRKNKLQIYFNFIYVFILIIIMSSPLYSNTIDFINKNLNTIIGSIGLTSVVLTIPHQLYEKKFWIALLIVFIGFFFKSLYLIDLLSIDFSTGMFHILVAISCQIAAFII